MEEKEVTFSDAAKAELAKLSDEAKNLVLHTIHSAAGLVAAEATLTRAHVLALGERFLPFFSAAAGPSALEQERDALKSQVEALTAQVATLSDQLAAAKAAPAAPAPSPAPEAPAPQPAEANVPAPAADPLSPPPAA